MSNQTALQALEQRLADLERKGNALIEVINDLRQEDGLPPLPPLGGGTGSGSPEGGASLGLGQIQSDTFYGKKLQTAVREYLEMRKAANAGPATPREIHEAITQGGYEFDAKSDDIALVGLRAMLRKRTNFFHKLPNGAYGLTKWYPDAKPAKASSSDQSEDDDEDADTETADDGQASSAA